MSESVDRDELSDGEREILAQRARELAKGSRTVTQRKLVTRVSVVAAGQIEQAAGNVGSIGAQMQGFIGGRTAANPR